MATEDFEDIIRKEIVDLRRVVKGSKLGKHITEGILIPILEKLNPVLDELINWMGFLIQDEIQYTLSDTKASGFIFDIYYVDPDAPYGRKSWKIGEYEPSEMGGPPFSPKGGGGDLPQSGTLYRSIVYEVRGSSVILGIQDIQAPYALWYNPDWPGKLFSFASSTLRPGRTSVYGAALDDPSPDSPYRPYWRETIDRTKPEIKRRIREEFKKALQEATRRPTVQRAVEVHIRWQSR